MKPVNIADKLARVTTPWSPKIIATYNDNDVMLARFKDTFVWHAHPDTDDFFLVVEGRIAIDLADGPVELDTGELFVVPRGQDHRPRALTDTAAVLLIEPRGTPNTGDPRTAAAKTRL